VVAISTRVPNGRVLPVYGMKGGGKTLKDAGAVFADNLSPQKSRILVKVQALRAESRLMLALQTTSSAAEIQEIFDR
jgi:L-asparaginase